MHDHATPPARRSHGILIDVLGLAGYSEYADRVIFLPGRPGPGRGALAQVGAPPGGLRQAGAPPGELRQAGVRQFEAAEEPADLLRAADSPAVGEDFILIPFSAC
jgi:hypothetical protein